MKFIILFNHNIRNKEEKMSYLLYLTIFASVITIALIISSIRSNINLKKNLVDSFGKIPKQKKYDFESIGSYYRYKKAHNDNLEAIDGITWDDLDMKQVFMRINSFRW